MSGTQVVSWSVICLYPVLTVNAEVQQSQSEKGLITSDL